MLYAKYWAGLDQRRYVNPYNIVSDLNRPEARVLNQKLADAAVTVLNSDSWIRNIDYSKKTAILTLGSSEITSIQRSLKPLFSNSLNYILPKDISDAEIENVKKELQSYEQIIVNIHDLRRRPAPVLDYTNGLKLFIADLAKMNSLFNVFANPYALAGLPGIESAKTLILNYQNTEQAQSATFRTITGEVKASGKLPVTVNSAFKNGDGIVQ